MMPRFFILSQDFLIAGKVVQHRHLERFVSEQHRLMLRVNVQQSGRKRRQHFKLRRTIIYKSPRPSGFIQYSTDYQSPLLRVEVYTVSFQQCGDSPRFILDGKLGLYYTRIPFGTDSGHICLFTEQKRQGSENNGLSGTGLTRNND